MRQWQGSAPTFGMILVFLATAGCLTANREPKNARLILRDLSPCPASIVHVKHRGKTYDQVPGTSGYFWVPEDAIGQVEVSGVALARRVRLRSGMLMHYYSDEGPVHFVIDRVPDPKRSYNVLVKIKDSSEKREVSMFGGQATLDDAPQGLTIDQLNVQPSDKNVLATNIRRSVSGRTVEFRFDLVELKL